MRRFAWSVCLGLAGAAAMLAPAPAAGAGPAPADAGAAGVAPPGSPVNTPGRRSRSVGDFVANAVPNLATLTVERARSLGKVVGEKVETRPSDWVSGEEARMRTLVLVGLELRFAEHRGREAFLVSATFTAPSWKLLDDLGVGAPEARVVRVLGEGQRDGSVLRYDGDEPAGFAEFTLRDGLVTKVTLTPYTG